MQCETPAALRAVLTEWPLISASMAETLTGSRCAASQRNLAWMEVRGLVREVTGQARLRMWRTKKLWPQQSVVSLSAAPLTPKTAREASRTERLLHAASV